MATIEIDGKTFEVCGGKTIIEVADEAGIPIPRFCYHKKLSVAANCRMCLVEVANSRKPVPACATPITDGMKVFTQSEEARRSQKAVMEFLLINHPLDCPICDQGGECELQDVSMGYGAGHSEYEEAKRSVVDDDLGTLISTEMTRCIQCTRCVRFGDEVAGVRELGAFGRGENMQIGTYVQHSMSSEVSANIIDLCPVGALTSKPYRFTARAWELQQSDGVAPHDCLGSNVHCHVRRNEMMRVVPKEQEDLNETWLSDRDRFSYLGMKSPMRARSPMIKKDGLWQEVDWETALTFAAEGMMRLIKQHGPEQFAAFSSPSSTLEESYLLQKLMRSMGVNNLDHRVRQTDFRDEDLRSTSHDSSLPYKELEAQQQILLIGCNIDRELPLAGVRVRKANKKGAAIHAINPVDYDFHFEVSSKFVVSPAELPRKLAELCLALYEDLSELPTELQRLMVGLEVDMETRVLAELLKKPAAVLVTGEIYENHPEAALLRTLVHSIALKSKASVLNLTTGANTAGARLAGMLPHRTTAGKAVENPGLNVQDALDNKLKGYLLLGLEPAYDFANPARSRQAMLGAEFVVVLSAFHQDAMRDYANVLLPIAPYYETSGTYINVDNLYQTVTGACLPFEDARPAWKILRVLGNLCASPGFDYESTEEVLQEIRSLESRQTPLSYQPYYPEFLPVSKDKLVRLGDWPLYRCDAIVRNALDLQHCAAADDVCLRIHPETASRLKLAETATVSQGDIEITLPLKRDARVALDVVWVSNGLPETIDLGHSFAAITIKR